MRKSIIQQKNEIQWDGESITNYIPLILHCLQIEYKAFACWNSNITNYWNCELGNEEERRGGSSARWPLYCRNRKSNIDHSVWVQWRGWIHNSDIVRYCTSLTSIAGSKLSLHFLPSAQRFVPTEWTISVISIFIELNQTKIRNSSQFSSAAFLLLWSRLK